MNIIVTNNLIEYNGFMKVSTLEKAIDVLGTINVLVYHKSNEPTESKVDYLTKLKDRVDILIYIRDKDAIEKAVQMIVLGSGGRYFDDEFFLENSSELNSLVRSLDEVTTIAELGGVNVLSDFFNRYLKNGSSGFNAGYLSIVKEAVSSMISDYKQKDLELLQLSETATEIFANSASIISKVETEREKLKELVGTLEEAKNNGQFEAIGRSTSTSSIMFFPQVPYLKERSIIRVKELGNCAYLTSFMLGLRIYLEHIKYVRPKLIFIMPVGKQYEELYSDFNWVTQQTSRQMENYYNKIIFTSFPNKDVLSKLLDDTEYDTFIVVDRLKVDKTHILNCKGGAVRYAVSGGNSLEKNGIKAFNCFSPREINGSLFTIPTFSDYPSEYDQRERLYERSCKTQYESLYNVKRN